MEVKSIATDAGRAKFVQLLRYSLVLKTVFLKIKPIIVDLI